MQEARRLLPRLDRRTRHATPPQLLAAATVVETGCPAAGVALSCTRPSRRQRGTMAQQAHTCLAHPPPWSSTAQAQRPKRHTLLWEPPRHGSLHSPLYSLMPGCRGCRVVATPKVSDSLCVSVFGRNPSLARARAASGRVKRSLSRYAGPRPSWRRTASRRWRCWSTRSWAWRPALRALIAALMHNKLPECTMPTGSTARAASLGDLFAFA